MIASTVPTISEYVEQYYLERQIKDTSVKQLAVAARALERFAGRGVPVSELSDELVNRWLVDLEQSGRSPHTVRGRRRDVLTLWRSARAAGLVETVRHDCEHRPDHQ